MAEHIDVGWARGETKGGSPWECVAFAQDQATFVNFTFRYFGSRSPDKRHVRHMMAREGLVEFSPNDPYSGASFVLNNELGQTILVVFVLVGNEDGLWSNPLPALRPMSEYVEDPRFKPARPARPAH